VTVVGVDGVWLAVEPPEGCSSLIAELYVDVGDGVHGVVNGDEVRVRVGSQLQPEKHYATQMKLSKGAEVDIVGRIEQLGSQESGYYKIVPPAGSKLWMSADYLERVPAELLALEAAAKTDPKIADADLTGSEADSTPDQAGSPSAALGSPARVAVGSAKPTAPPAPSVEDLKARRAEHRRRIEELDAEIQAELAKPLLLRDFSGIVERFTPLAEQTADDFVRLYARMRIEQLEDMIEAIDAVASVRQMGEQVKEDRQVALTARAAIRPAIRTIGEGFDVEGELRLSAIYNSPVGPRRYRLVDPASDQVRTLAYIEIPPDSDIEVEDYLGRIIGVRAREVRLQTGDVDPIAIYVANELVVLERAGEVAGETG
jgi:hypothetical protein